MAVIKKDQYFADVPASNTSAKEYIVPDGETLQINVAYGEAGLSPDTVSSIYWDLNGADHKLIYATHGANVNPYISFSVVGDGVKKLTMCLTNNQLASDLLGVGWRD